MRNIFIVSSIVVVALIVGLSFLWQPILWSFVLIGPIIILGTYDCIQKKHAIKRNFPVIGNFRYLLEGIRPEIMQYFVETDLEGRPFNRIQRSLVYRRAKNVSDTTPFGTQEDTYERGYEWINHSIYAKNYDEMPDDFRVMIGGEKCSQPYSCSLLNIGAMSFGSLSDRAVTALNGGAKISKFAHNTGEGGISPYHKEPGGDLIYQVGTGYFGARAEDGTFSREKFIETASHPSVKMIELKLSQGAKPGHGGILPAKKNTPQIAAIRGVKPGTSVLSPPRHSAFTTPEELLALLDDMRELSGGKPVGFKLCIGRKQEFVDICKAMVQTGRKPDFIAIDGGEGGTGAAPVEFSDSVGTPYRDGLAFAIDILKGFDLKKDIKVIASGKISSGFHILKAIALGADACYSARAMMMSLGCIQALLCNTNTCPVGIATQDHSLIAGLDVTDKRARVAFYHKKTIHSFIELLGASGYDDPSDVSRSDINRRVNLKHILTYEEIYPSVKEGSFLNGKADERYKNLVLEKALV